MRVLGIESTAHTFGIGILDNDRILADVRRIYKPEIGGINPTDAAEYHAKNSLNALKESLEKANLKLKDLDCVSFSKGPGLAPCLDIASNLARFLSLRLEIPILGINHAIAHLEISKLFFNVENPLYLYVSGGNSQIISYYNGKYRVFGETLDLALGNALDKFARTIGLEHPGGPKIEKLASKGRVLIDLPYVVKGMDFSFSGILTALEKLYRQGKYSLEDLCYSFQEYVFSMILEASERAMAYLNSKELVITGGVAANKRFAEMAKTMCEERNAKALSIPQEYCGDNGVMIAYLGFLRFKNGARDRIEDLRKNPYWRADEVEVDWL